MSQIRIALANVRPAATRDEAVDIAESTIDDASRAGADVVCFPECYIPGYRIRLTPRSMLPPDPAFLESAWDRVARAAKRGNVGVVLGTERVVDGAPRITVLVVDRDGSPLGFQDKVQLDPSEDDTFASGAGRHVFRVGDLAFGISICHEGWRYPETVRWAARRGAHIVFHPHFHEPEPGAFRPTSFGDPRNTFHEKAVLCRAAENTVYFASVNCAMDGSPTTSAVAKPDGATLAWQPYGKEGLLIADIDTDAATGLLASRCRTVA